MSADPNHSHAPIPIPPYVDPSEISRRSFAKIAALGLITTVLGVSYFLTERRVEITASPNATPTPNPMAQELGQYRASVSERIATVMQDPHVIGRKLTIPDTRLPGEAELISARTTDPNHPFGTYRIEQYVAASNPGHAVIVGATEYTRADDARPTNSDITRGLFILGQPDGSLTISTLERGTSQGIDYIYGTMINSPYAPSPNRA